MDHYHDASKAYLEHYAKELLETLFPERYSHLEHSERPDLIMGDDYGIEVTWAMFENQGRANGLLTVTAGKTMEELNKGIRRNIEKANIEMLAGEDGIICGYTDRSHKNKVTDYDLLREYLKKKNKAEGYSTKKTDLFIFPALAQIDDWLGKEIIEGFLKDIADTEDRPFNNIIVYEEPTLYLYDYSNKEMLIMRGQQEQIIKCMKSADEYSGYSKRYHQ